MTFASVRRWVAEAALARLGRFGNDGMLILVGEKYEIVGQVQDRMERIIRRAKQLLAAFLRGEPLSSSLIRAAINLAHCDTYYRIGRLDERFGSPHAAEVRELRRLIEVTDFRQLVATDSCLLNPVFGEGSMMLGGADADLLVDDLLIEVKTTAMLKIRTEDWRQIIAYAALNEHFPIGGGRDRVAIRRLGFYFSRYGYLASWGLEELVDPATFAAFAEWLRDYACEAHAHRLARRAELVRKMAETMYGKRHRTQHVPAIEAHRNGAQRRMGRSRTSTRLKVAIKSKRASIRLR